MGNPALLRSDGSQILEAQFQCGCALGDIDMEGPHVDAIAHPGNRPPIGRDHEPGHVRDGIGWRMRPGEPLWIEQRNPATPYRDRLVHVEDAVADVGDIYAEGNRALEGLIQRRGNWRRQRRGLRTRRILTSNRGAKHNRARNQGRRKMAATGK